MRGRVKGLPEGFDLATAWRVSKWYAAAFTTLLAACVAMALYIYKSDRDITNGRIDAVRSSVVTVAGKVDGLAAENVATRADIAAIAVRIESVDQRTNALMSRVNQLTLDLRDFRNLQRADRGLPGTSAEP